jgi:hypothetical protein
MVRGAMRRLASLVVILATGMAWIGLVGPVATARVRSAAATVTLTLNKGTILADGRDSATLDITATFQGSPLADLDIKVTSSWSTPTGSGNIRIHPALVRLDGSGGGTADIDSTRSGTMLITAMLHAPRLTGGASVTLNAVRHSVVVLVDGGASTVTCPAQGACVDPSGIFAPVVSALTAEGYSSSDIATFSYAGGSVDAATGGWMPRASTCADSGASFKTQLTILDSMLRSIASSNPNSDISMVGISQGGLLVFQTAMTSPTLPKGSRLAHLMTIDAPLGGLALSDIQHLEAEASTACWSEGGTSPAATQLVSLWNSTTPNQGPAQGDKALTMCSRIRFARCIPETNADAASSVSGTTIQTWGSTSDAVFDPLLCGFGGLPDGRDSQIVASDGGLLADEGNAPGYSCTLGSHIAGASFHAGDIALTVGPQK